MGPVVETKHSCFLLLSVPSHDVKKHGDGKGDGHFEAGDPKTLKYSGIVCGVGYIHSKRSHSGQGGGAGWL